MSLNPIDHTAEAERLIAIGQKHLSDPETMLDDSMDLAGLSWDKAMVHATLAQVEQLASIAESLRAIVKTDEAIETIRPISSSEQFHAAQRENVAARLAGSMKRAQ